MWPLVMSNRCNKDDKDPIHFNLHSNIATATISFPHNSKGQQMNQRLRLTGRMMPSVANLNCARVKYPGFNMPQ